MGQGPQRPAGDIGNDATLDGSMLATVAPPASSAGVSGMTGAGMSHSGSRGPLLVPRALPADLDRSGLGERERDLVVSRYILLSRLGAGGMGLVYLAYDPSLDRKVAVKLLRPVGDGVEPAAEAHARLHREAQALAKLSHPNVVAVHDVGTYDASALYGTPRGEDSGQGVFLVMEYIEGATLAHWLEERPRSWQEVVAAFLAAGHGLVAAHAVGVIHRDFKPSNVLVKASGSVHVFDFGLARAAGDGDAPRTAPQPESMHVTYSSTLSSPLTQYGAFVGTPAYMAPEQRGGENVDERSDQFSFCVALYEGLCGNRPFSGENVYALEMAKVRGVLDPPSRRRRLPKGLMRAVTRGLAAEPNDRWPTLPALLAELDGHLRRRRGRVAAAVLAVATLGAAAGAWATTRSDVCSGASAAFADTWGEGPRAALDDAFAATHLPYAADTAARVAERLDNYRFRWLAMHTDACQATHVRRTQAPALMDRRMVCLQQRRDELAALLAVLTAADADAVKHAVTATAELPPVEDCADLEKLAEHEATPADPGAALALFEGRRHLAAAQAERTAGRVASSREHAREALAIAERLGDRDLRAHAEGTIGRAQLDLAEHADGERQLAAAYFDSLAVGHDHLAVENATLLAFLVGDVLARPAEGLAWTRHVDALLDRIGRPAGLVAGYHNCRGNIAVRSGDYEAGEAAYRAAIAAYEEESPLDELELGAALNNLMSTIGTMGKFAEALEIGERALQIRSATLGPAHPEIGTLLTNMGTTYALSGDLARAEAVQRRSLQILRAGLPARHERIAFPLGALGDLALGRADYDGAAAFYDEARQIWEQHFGPAHPSVLIMQERLATALYFQGALAPAHALAERALRGLDALATADPGGLTLALLTLSQIQFAEGDHARARGLAERARNTAAAAFGETHLYTLSAAMLLENQRLDLGGAAEAPPGLAEIAATIERTDGPEARWIVEPLLLLGRARHGVGDLAGARTDLARARALAVTHDLPGVIAEIDLARARVLWDDGGDRAAAHALAREAAASHRRSGAARLLQETEAWLTAHPPP